MIAAAEASVAHEYRRSSLRRLGLVGGALMLLVAFLLVDISVGPGNYALSAVVQTLLHPQDADARVSLVVWDYRLPIALTAVLIGAMLGVAGASMQTILGNPLADPFTLGVSAAASVGAALAITFNWSLWPGSGAFIITSNAFLFALAASVLLFVLTKLRGVTPQTMILVGIAVMFTCNAIIGLVQYSSNETQLEQIVFWMMGSLGRSSIDKVEICALLLLIGLPWLMTRSWKLTALHLGDERAAALGIRVDGLRLEVLAFVALFAAVSVAFVGAISFVGLVGPHIARLIVGEDQRFFLPTAALSGAIILSIASTLSKSITPGVIYPIGIVTALIGVPFFVSLLLSIRNREM